MGQLFLFNYRQQIVDAWTIGATTKLFDSIETMMEINF